MSSDLEKKIMENENQDGNQDPQSPEKTTLVETLLKICDEMRGTRKLITTEVCKLESKLSEKITQETQKVNDNIDEKLAPLLADVEELKVRVDTCEEKISGLKEEMIKHRKEGRHAIIKYDQLVVERKPVLQPSTTRVASYDREIPPELMDISESENEVDTQESQDEEKEEGKKKKQNTSPDLAFQSVRINSDQGRKKLKLTKKKVLAMRQANLNGYIQSGSKPNNNGEKEEKINKEREKDKNQGKEENIIPVNNPSSSKTKQ
ncbi:hypothetical protein M8J76_009818 [Diaphorina citri]|nr:hypothetical protein M8J76_002754 [Diaphorina citri]KAI5741422.1 hypothetical protein M8J76_013459 [Diaphorina citri]KAI5749743.1 hypothetical protein M8J76_009818 [Diaphorina citri]